MRPRPIFLILYAASGFAALLFEVTWTRLLSLHLGQTVAATSTVLAAFMGGLAAGATVGGRMAPRVDPRRALRWYAALEASVGAIALILPLAIAAARPLLAMAYGDSGGSMFALLRAAIGLALVSVPAAAMGATFPFAIRSQLSDGDGHGRAGDVGALYAANAVGGAAGVLATGFWLLPMLGTRGTTIVGTMVSVAVAAGAWWLSKSDLPLSLTPAPTTRPVRQSASGFRLQASGRKLARFFPKPEARPPSPKAMAVRRSDMKSVREGGSPKPDDSPARSTGSVRRDRRKPVRPEAGATPIAAPVPVWAALLAIFVSGFTALAVEVVVSRLAALLIGPTTYAFSAMLLAFIVGLAAGSTIGARLARRSSSGVWLGVTMLVGAAGIANLFWLVGRLPLAVASLAAGPKTTFAALLAQQVATIVIALAPATIAFGAAFPLAVAVAQRGAESIARRAAVVYAVNTAGAICGSLAAGFVLVPRLGLEHTLAGATLLLAFCGLTIVWTARPASSGAGVPAGGTGAVRALSAIAATAVVGLVIARPSWDRSLLSSGVYKYAEAAALSDMESALVAGTLLYYADGASATVSVRESVDSRSLAIDGKVDASNAGDMLTQKLLAHLPLLLHPSPKEACILGLGSGVTAGAALTHPLTRLDVLEISPEVVEASRFFAVENRNALSDVRTQLMIGDGRTHLQLSPRTYDVIVSEPSNPWMAGVAALFTREFFASVRARLKSDGVFCQWAHTYDLSEANLRSIAGTFHSVFPTVTMWLVGGGDVLFIGSPVPLEPRLAMVEQALRRPGVLEDLREVSVADAFGLLSLYLGGDGQIGAYAAGARVQTDDRRALEFDAPRDLHEGTGANVAGSLRQAAAAWVKPDAVARAVRDASPDAWRSRGQMMLRSAAFDVALADLTRVVEAQPTDGTAIDLLLDAAAGQRMAPDRLTALIVDLTKRHGRSIPLRLALSRMHASAGLVEQALADAEAAHAIDPADVRPIEQLASIFADVQDGDRLAAVVTELEKRTPAASATLYYAATLRFLSEQWAEAAALAAKAVEADPRHARAHNLLGAARASLGQLDQAQQAFLDAHRADPREPSTYVNLGQLALQRGQVAEAASRFAEALTLDPRSPAARAGLAEALERQGEFERAARLRAR